MSRTVRALSLSLVAGLALAATAPAALAATGEMMLEINDSQRVGLYGTAASVVVGNPQVADVSMLDSHSLVISAKGFGATRVQVFDGRGRELFNRRVTIVVPQSDQVTLYRGLSASEFNCARKCQLAVAAGPSAASESAPKAATDPSSAQPAADPSHP